MREIQVEHCVLRRRSTCRIRLVRWDLIQPHCAHCGFRIQDLYFDFKSPTLNLLSSGMPFNSASIFPHFSGNPQFSFSLEISAQEKNLQTIFFFVKNLFPLKKKSASYNNFPQIKWRLNSPAREEQKKIVEENGE